MSREDARDAFALGFWTALSRFQRVFEWLLILVLILVSAAIVVTGIAGVVYLVIAAWKAMLG